MDGPAGGMGIGIGYQQIDGRILPQGFDDTGSSGGAGTGEEGFCGWFNCLLVYLFNGTCHPERVEGWLSPHPADCVSDPSPGGRGVGWWWCYKI